MKPGTFLVGLAVVLFALSLVANFVTVAQLREVTAVLEASKKNGKSVRPARVESRSGTSADPRLQTILDELASLRHEVRTGEALSVGNSSPISTAAPTSSAPVASAVSVDPEVGNVLAAQSQFRTFWKDLDNVFNAKDKLDPEKYRQTVLDATVKFLGIGEPQRSVFLTESALAVDDLAGARREYYELRGQVPPREQIGKAQYDSQRKVISNRYKDRRDAAVVRVTRLLDTSSIRHQEFADRTEKWLREMRP